MGLCWSHERQRLQRPKQQSRRSALRNHKGVEQAKLNRRAQESLRHGNEMVAPQKAPFCGQDKDHDDDTHNKSHGNRIAFETDRPDRHRNPAYDGTEQQAFDRL